MERQKVSVPGSDFPIVGPRDFPSVGQSWTECAAVAKGGAVLLLLPSSEAWVAQWSLCHHSAAAVTHLSYM